MWQNTTTNIVLCVCKQFSWIDLESQASPRGVIHFSHQPTHPALLNEIWFGKCDLNVLVKCAAAMTKMQFIHLLTCFIFLVSTSDRWATDHSFLLNRPIWTYSEVRACTPFFVRLLASSSRRPVFSSSHSYQYLQLLGLRLSQTAQETPCMR